MAKVIGIVGSRRRNKQQDFQAVENAFLKIYEKGDSLCSGGCPKGADHFAEMLSETYRVPIKIFPADWKQYGLAAGPIRNTDIAKTSDVLIACVAQDRTGGTEDTVKKYKRLGKTRLVLV